VVRWITVTALADIVPRAPEPAARVRHLLRTRVLERASVALRERSLDALLVKGAALALTVYRPAWSREMSDVDMVVRPGARDRVLDALVGAGFERGVVEGRPLSASALGETHVFATLGETRTLVEVHTQLDKIVARPVAYAAIFDRATPAPGLPGLLVPSDEDHLLLVALHEACSEFRHPVGFADLHALLARGVDMNAVHARAREWKLRTALFVALSTLRALGSPLATDALVRSFAPSRLRRAALASFYRVGAYPVARGRFQLGLAWVARQGPLRDDGTAWLRGVGHYACLRAAELPTRSR
jgi:hypothetical protein